MPPLSANTETTTEGEIIRLNVDFESAKTLRDTHTSDPFDVVLVPSFNGSGKNPLGIERLAEGCSQKGQKTGIFESEKDQDPGTAFFDTERLINDLLEIASCSKSIGFGVFNQDMKEVLEFLKRLDVLMTYRDLPLKKIFLGGVGITTNIEFWHKELSNLLDKTSLRGKIQILLVSGEADDVFPGLVEGESYPEGVFDMDSNDSELARIAPIIVSSAEDPKHLPISPLEFKDRTSREAVGIGIDEIRRKLRACLDEYLVDRNIDKFKITIGNLVVDLRPLSVAELEFSRGCPNKCSYCSQNQLFPLRQMAPETAALQLSHAFEAGKTHICLTDNSLLPFKWWEKLGAMKKGTPYGDWVTFGGFMDPRVLRTYSAEEIAALAQLGVREMTIGLQSAYAPELKRMNRPTESPQWILEKLPALYKAGIDIWIDLIKLYPGYHRDFFEIERTNRQFFQKATQAIGRHFSTKHHAFYVLPTRAGDIFDTPNQRQRTSIVDHLSMTNGINTYLGLLRAEYIAEQHSILPIGKFGSVLQTPYTGRYSFQLKQNDPPKLHDFSEAKGRADIKAFSEDLRKESRHPGDIHILNALLTLKLIELLSAQTEESLDTIVRQALNSDLFKNPLA